MVPLAEEEGSLLDEFLETYRFVLIHICHPTHHGVHARVLNVQVSLLKCKLKISGVQILAGVPGQKLDEIVMQLVQGHTLEYYPRMLDSEVVEINA